MYIFQPMMGNVSENEANKHQSHDLEEKDSEESNEQEYQGNTIIGKNL